MRLPDWKARLNAYVTACARQPYAMGQHDCALFAAGAMEAVCGIDPAVLWRGKYITKSAGLRLVRRAGHADHIAVFAALLDEIAPAYAAAGDIAVVAGEATALLGVVQGEGVYVLRPEGLGIVPRAMMQRAFRT